jgi:hypothetical protein
MLLTNTATAASNNSSFFFIVLYVFKTGMYAKHTPLFSFSLANISKNIEYEKQKAKRCSFQAFLITFAAKKKQTIVIQ